MLILFANSWSKRRSGNRPTKTPVQYSVPTSREQRTGRRSQLKVIGNKLNHYEIAGRLGQGGMGEVYVARDTKLNRSVALKVLPSAMAADADRRARFEREAQAVAALNHPNIVTIFSVEEDDGVHFITMAHVEGKTLTELLPHRSFALNKLLEIVPPEGLIVDAGVQPIVLSPDGSRVALVLDDGLWVRSLASHDATQLAGRDRRIPRELPRDACARRSESPDQHEGPRAAARRLQAALQARGIALPDEDQGADAQMVGERVMAQDQGRLPTHAH